MKNALRAVAAACVLLGVTSVAVAANTNTNANANANTNTNANANANNENPSECPKNCPHPDGAEAKPLAATPRKEAPSRGPADARVTVEEWSDFQCPFCSRGAQTVTQLRQKYGDKIRIVFRQAPLPFHDHARQAALASLAAHEQGRFWEFHDALFAHQNALDRASLEALAGKLGLDVARFRRSLDANTWGAYVDQELAEMRSRGIQGTPTFFINGEAVVGAQPIEEFTKRIDAALAH